MVDIFAGTGVSTPLQISPTARDGECNLSEDMFFCGNLGCEMCDYTF